MSNNEIEISKLTGWTHRGSWKFWCIPFTPDELGTLLARFPSATTIVFGESIWKHVRKDKQFLNWFSEVNAEGDVVGYLAGRAVKLVDR
jgi:hypothetical protein